jgi:hypothetical protein
MELRNFIEQVSSKLKLHGLPNDRLPNWALLQICLGYWARLQHPGEKRFLAILLLPTREYSSVFTTLGALMAGAEEFSDELNWPKFKHLARETTVYWQSTTSSKGYSGSTQGIVEMYGQEFIEVRIQTAPRKLEVGTKRQISKAHFQDYRFSLEKPLGLAKTQSTLSAWTGLKGLLPSFSENWLTTDGSELLVVTTVQRFLDEAKSISFHFQDTRIELGELLCTDRNRDSRVSKTKVEPSKGAIAGTFPLVILDGITPYYIQEHIDQKSNILIILSRSEFDQGVFEDVADLATAYPKATPKALVDVLNTFASCEELTIFELDNSS